MERKTFYISVCDLVKEINFTLSQSHKLINAVCMVQSVKQQYLTDK